MVVVVTSRRTCKTLLVTLLLATATGGCAAVDAGVDIAAVATEASKAPTGPTAPLRLPTDAPPPGSVPERVSALADRRGLHPGLTAVPGPDKAKARATIAEVRAGARGSSAGYDRERDFGAAWKDDVDITWGHDGCPTREEILHRDMKGLEFRGGTDECVILEGTLQEPYTGRTVFFNKSRPMEVQVDHVVPLSYAWHQGARRWSQGRREQLANDPLNLLAVDGPTNQSKSDSGPADWLPPNRRVRCAYAVRFALVARRYAVTVTQADRRAMLRACRT
jgi:hypothetical protein